jgi:hypothetical protein
VCEVDSSADGYVQAMSVGYIAVSAFSPMITGCLPGLRELERYKKSP